MTSPLRLGLIAAAGVLLFDVLASLLSRFGGIPYESFSIGSFLIYLAAGFVAQRRFGFRVAALIGGVTALVESTLGWGLSALIGPGGFGSESPAVTDIVLIVIVVVTAGALAAMLGAGLARTLAKEPMR